MFSADDLPLGAILVAVIIVASAMTMPMLPSSPHSGDAKKGSVQTPTDASQAAPTEPGESEMYAVPDTRTQTAAEEIEPPEVAASAGSQTMDVTTKRADGGVVLELSDERTHDGRWVSVPTKWFNEALGEMPEVAYVEHENGSTYSANVHVRGDSAAFYVRGFSTNEVTFSGEVDVSANPATDGSQFSYQIEDASGASDPQGTLTGAMSTEWDNVSASGLADGDTLAVNPAGHEIRGPASGEPEIVFTGEVQTNTTSESGTVTPDASRSIIDRWEHRSDWPQRGAASVGDWPRKYDRGRL
jgi:hypothetical protein